jgi:hypothetical protein
MSNELAHTMNNWSHCDNPDFVMVPATTAPLCFPFLAKLFVLVPFHSAVSGWTKQGVKGIPGVHCRLNGHAMQTPLFADHLLSRRRVFPRWCRLDAYYYWSKVSVQV